MRSGREAVVACSRPPVLLRAHVPSGAHPVRCLSDLIGDRGSLNTLLSALYPSRACEGAGSSSTSRRASLRVGRALGRAFDGE
jgi:hypothetical protein